MREQEPKKPESQFKVNSLSDYKATKKILKSGELTMGQSFQATHALLDFIDEHRD